MMNKGPNPEGTYHVRQLNFQTTDNLNWFEAVHHHLIGRLSWSGGETAWGMNHIWV